MSKVAINNLNAHKKHVMFIIEYISSGPGRVTTNLANGFISKGYDVSLLVYQNLDTDYELDSHIVKQSLEVHGKTSLIMRLSGLIQKRKGIKAFILRQNPDIVISLSGAKTNTIISWVCKRLEKPFILSERNNPYVYPSSKIIRLFRLISFRQANHIVFQSEGAKAFFSTAIQSKSSVIANPLKSDLPDVFEGEKSKRIVNFCRLEPQKNLALLIRAFSNLADDYKSYNLYIYGDGGQKGILETMIVEMGLVGRVYILPFQRDVLELVQDATLYVSSSDYEGLSNSTLEALAMGIPVISTDSPPGGARTFIKNGVNGLLVPVGDESALTEAIKQILSNEALQKEVASSGVQIREQLNVAHICNEWEKLFE